MTPASWTVVFSAAAGKDLELIEAHLLKAYLSFGEGPKATIHASTRIEAIIVTADRLASAPLCGQARDDLLAGLRYLSFNGAIYWFVPDEVSREVRVLAIFFGGQDHQRHMLVRLLQSPGV